jgi:flagellar assembly protein FliH
MSNSFEALWGPPKGSFEALELGSGGESGGSFSPLPGFSVTPSPPSPIPQTPPTGAPAGAGSALISTDSGEVSAAPTPEDPSPAEPSLASDGALLKAREEAFEIGRNEGLEAGREEVAAQLARVADLLDQVDGARAELVARSIADLSAAVLHIARAIVRRELAVDSDGVEDLVRSIFKEVRSEDEVVIRVAEEDAWMMREAYPSLLEMVGRDGEVRILVDPTLKPGGAIVETSHGTIDASIEAQFASFAAEIDVWTVQEVEVRDD